MTRKPARKADHQTDPPLPDGLVALAHLLAEINVAREHDAGAGEDLKQQAKRR